MVLSMLGFTARADLYDEVEDIDKVKPNTKEPVNPSPSPTATLKRPVENDRQSTPAPTQTNPESADTKNPQPKGKPASANEKREPVYFESVGLEGMRSQGLIKLLEKVIVTQGDMRLEADRATVHFDKKTEEVSKVVATGNVKLLRTDPETRQKVRAESNEVLFDNLERKLTLKGNAKLWRGGDLVRGKQIVYELDTGWIKADRVEGIVQPAAEKEDSSKSGQSKPPATNTKPLLKKNPANPAGKGI